MNKLRFLQFGLLLFFVLGYLIANIQASRSISSDEPGERDFYEAREMSQTALKLKNNLVGEKSSSGDMILEDNDSFEVKYLVSNDQFVVTVNKEPFLENKQKAQNWFLMKGFRDFDLCLLQISFVPEIGVSSPKPKDQVFDKCPYVPEAFGLPSEVI